MIVICQLHLNFLMIKKIFSDFLKLKAKLKNTLIKELLLHFLLKIQYVIMKESFVL